MKNRKLLFVMTGIFLLCVAFSVFIGFLCWTCKPAPGMVLVKFVGCLTSFLTGLSYLVGAGMWCINKCVDEK